MRKYLIGVLVGAVLMAAGTALADSESKIGKVIQAEISVIFEGAELETTGIVVDGVSYLPLRAIGTVLGLNVDYADGKAILYTPSKQEVADLEQVTEEIRERVKEEIKEEIKLEQVNAERQKKINDLKDAITNLEDQLENPESYGLHTETSKNTVRAVIEKYKQQLAELEAE